MKDRNKYVLLIVCVLSGTLLKAQLLDTIGATPVIYKNKYLHYLLIPTENTKASLLNFNIQYLYMPEVKTFATGGLHINVGLNLARFFTRQFILGISADLKFFLGYTHQPLPRSFVNDFNSSFIYYQASKKDSARAQTLKEGINSTSGYGIKGNNFGNYGLCFSPFPNKWGGILVQAKYGYRNFPFFGSVTREIQDDKPYLHLILKNVYTFEVSLKPYRFFNSKTYSPQDKKPKNFYKHILITFYFERLTLNNASFNDVPLARFVDQNFISKYDRVDQFGIKVGFGIY